MDVRRVTTPGGYVSVTERGPVDRPHLVLVHGYPDRSSMWDRVVEGLVADHHVTAYDVRGAGASARPAERSAYAMPHLLEDLAAVIDATSTGRPVHLVGHDWGAIQGFAAIADRELPSRLRSFTAVSAPGLDVARAWVRRRTQAPTRGQLAELAGQAVRSWYLAAFQLPVLPEAVLRAADAAGRRFGRSSPPFVLADVIDGLSLYRANRRRTGDGAGGTGTDVVPTQVVTGRRDPFVSPRVFDDLRRVGVPVTEVDAGHWLPRTHPALVASAVRSWVAEVERAGEDGAAAGAG